MDFMYLYSSFRTLFHLDDGGGPRGANGNAPRTPGRGLVSFDLLEICENWG